MARVGVMLFSLVNHARKRVPNGAKGGPFPPSYSLPDRDPALPAVKNDPFCRQSRENPFFQGVQSGPTYGRLGPKSAGFPVVAPKKRLLLLREGTACRNIEGHVVGRVQTPSGFRRRRPGGHAPEEYLHFYKESASVPGCLAAG